MSIKLHNSSHLQTSPSLAPRDFGSSCRAERLQEHKSNLRRSYSGEPAGAEHAEEGMDVQGG